ncbi:hypothetical protein QFZ81_003727 [Paenibacillus sp. V4I9]|uniref:HEAT repeat domain-containing protein n=1 Tax=Paenibacillus sp. V4I9 TaxID=3042308 RepID=UPI00278B8116|nr:HEAT repeat domain-containing protein [Paenibacillus sp. V4I9]MDQ0888639.1 hypothetical protein [Paenibacillus sp. V4I9]
MKESYVSSLIKTMYMKRRKKYLLELINRMSFRDNAKSSDESISFKAYREADALNNRYFIQMLIEIVNFHKSLDGLNVRKGAYFILSKLLKKHSDSNALQFLIDQLHKESDKYAISSLLDCVSDLEKSDIMDIEPIIQLTRNDNWQIRHSAIRALKASKNPRAKQVVLEIITNGSNEVKMNQYDIIYATSVLSDIGVIEDITILKELSKVNIRDVRESAIFAIESIKQRDGN